MSISLFLLGIGCLFWCVRYTYEMNKQQMINPNSQITQIKKRKDNHQKLDNEEKHFLGGLVIPSIKQSIKLYSAAVEPYITFGVGLDVADRKFGKDNVVLAGHDYENVLGNLNRVQIGDNIFVLESGKLYEFVVSEIFLANSSQPTDIKRVRENLTMPMLTLYTCVGETGTTKRLVVQANFRGEREFDRIDDTTKRWFSGLFG